MRQLPDVYIRLSKVRSSLGTSIHKIVPKALESKKDIESVCDGLTYFRDLLIYSFSTPFPNTPNTLAFVLNGGCGERIA
ncbi:hypothetical protein TNCV_1312701 [Trichonephila clavipes]|nr:hypothetical protein TNCV_1312701 [Trichonephila clavipes]